MVGTLCARWFGRTGNQPQRGTGDGGTAAYIQGLTAQWAAPGVLTPRHPAGILSISGSPPVQTQGNL